MSAGRGSFPDKRGYLDGCLCLACLGSRSWVVYQRATWSGSQTDIVGGSIRPHWMARGVVVVPAPVWLRLAFLIRPALASPSPSVCGSHSVARRNTGHPRWNELEVGRPSLWVTFASMQNGKASSIRAPSIRAPSIRASWRSTSHDSNPPAMDSVSDSDYADLEDCSNSSYWEGSYDDDHARCTANCGSRGRVAAGFGCPVC